MSEVKRYVTSEFMGLAPDCSHCEPNVDDREFVLASDYDDLRDEIEAHKRSRQIDANEARSREQELCAEVESLKAVNRTRHDALREARAEVERLRAQLSLFADEIASNLDGLKDAACRECYPNGTQVVEGFVCVWHQAKQVAQTRLPDPTPASLSSGP